MAEIAQVPEDKGIKYVQLRLTPAQRNTLAEAAGKADRTVPEEILHRCRLEEPAFPVPASAAADPAVFGWSDPTRARTLADAFGALVGDILDYSADEADQPATLAMIGFAATELLAGLGASADLTDEQKAQARLSAQQVLRKIRRVEPDPTAYSEKPEMATYAALAQAWLAASFRTKTEDPNRKE